MMLGKVAVHGFVARKCELEAGEPFAMFTDALGEKYFLSDKRHGAGVRCLRENVTSENFVLWKSNKKVLVCQRISEDCRNVCRGICAECYGVVTKARLQDQLEGG